MRLTVGHRVTVVGEGIRTGRKVRVTFCPAMPDSGLAFLVDGKPIPATFSVADTRWHTTALVASPAFVLGVEHVLAACRVLGFDDLLIAVDGAVELPSLDGASLCFASALLSAGRQQQPGMRMVLKVRRPVEVHMGLSWGRAGPLDGHALEISVELDCPSPIGFQEFAAVIDEGVFVNQLARARSFRFWPTGCHDRPPSNTIRWREGRILTPLHFPNEFAAHKALDLIGDLALLPAPLVAQIRVHRPVAVPVS